ncbi:MAG: hypothetical protein LRY50_03810 [Geovibrio sp.]|nr:hypothetical protein [Geovibrio sp.]
MTAVLIRIQIMNRRHKMRKLIISVIMITALTAVAYSEGFKFNNMPQPEITYDMNKIYGQMQEFTDKFRKEGPTKTPQLIYLFSDSVPAITMENVFAQAKKSPHWSSLAACGDLKARQTKISVGLLSIRLRKARLITKKSEWTRFFSGS